MMVMVPLGVSSASTSAMACSAETQAQTISAHFRAALLAYPLTHSCAMHVQMYHMPCQAAAAYQTSCMPY